MSQLEGRIHNQILVERLTETNLVLMLQVVEPFAIPLRLLGS